MVVLLKFDVFLGRVSPSKSAASKGSPISAGAMMGDPGVCTSSSIGSGSRGGREMKDMLDKLPWLGRPASLESKGDSGGVCPTGGSTAAAPAAAVSAFWLGTSTGLLGAASATALSGSVRTGTGTGCLGSNGLGAATAPEADLVEPTGEAAREVMGRAWEFLMSVEPWACASEAWAGATARWFRTEMGARVLVVREWEAEAAPDDGWSVGDDESRPW